MVSLSSYSIHIHGWAKADQTCAMVGLGIAQVKCGPISCEVQYTSYEDQSESGSNILYRTGRKNIGKEATAELCQAQGVIGLYLIEVLVESF